MKKGVRFRIYPNKVQQKLIMQTFGCCRLIYNKALAMREEGYKQGEKVSYNQTSAMLTSLKQELEFLREVDSISLQQSLRDLDRAYTNFFQKRAKYPKFKSKHDNHQSYRTINQGNNIRIVGKYIKLPKLGYIKVRQSMAIGKINNVTIERTPTGKYFAVLNVEFEPTYERTGFNEIGIDVGIKEFYTDSNGKVVANPKHLEKSTKKLIREQRRLSRKVKGSSNRNKQRARVAKVHEKITNQRNDFLHKLSTMLVRENQTICIEDLNVKNLAKNHKLARSISSVSWSKFFVMLEYKSAWYGSTVVKIPTNYPSSQTCGRCGYKNALVKNLYVRKWDCPNCGEHHDRDINAARNILNKGLQLLA